MEVNFECVALHSETAISAVSETAEMERLARCAGSVAEDSE